MTSSNCSKGPIYNREKAAFLLNKILMDHYNCKKAPHYINNIFVDIRHSSHTSMYLRNTISHTYFWLMWVRVSVCQCPEWGFLRRKKQSPSEVQTEAPGHAGSRGLGYWKAKQGERKPGESKITLFCPDMTVNWAQGFWVSRLPRPNIQLFSEGPNHQVKIRPSNYDLEMNEE